MTTKSNRKFIVVKHPDLPAKEIDLQDEEISLEMMQKIVGGYIERLSMKIGNDVYLSAIFDEEGRFKSKKPNVIMLDQGRAVGTIVGTIVICADDGEEFVPLTADEARRAANQLNYNAMHIR